MRLVAPHRHTYGQGPDCGSNAILIHRKPPSREHARLASGNKRDKEHPMFDVLMLALGLGLFAVGIGYAYACERL
jgi:hypothetical protein